MVIHCWIGHSSCVAAEWTSMAYDMLYTHNMPAAKVMDSLRPICSAIKAQHPQLNAEVRWPP